MQEGPRDMPARKQGWPIRSPKPGRRWKDVSVKLGRASNGCWGSLEQLLGPFVAHSIPWHTPFYILSPGVANFYQLVQIANSRLEWSNGCGPWFTTPNVKIATMDYTVAPPLCPPLPNCHGRWPSGATITVAVIVRLKMVSNKLL